MKKITSKEPISFRIDGSTLLEIDSEGCLASDAHALVAVERLGGNITVEESSLKEAIKDAKETVETSKEKKKREKAEAAEAKANERGKHIVTEADVELEPSLVLGEEIDIIV